MWNVLIVEDETIVAKDIERRLKSLGYIVPSVVSSGKKAIKKAEEDNPDLVLMDIVLKGEMDGIEAAEHIRYNLDIPVVFLTAYADEKTLKRAKTTQPYGYIVKPFEDRELRATIETALYKHRIEKKIRESEQWLSTTLRSISDAVITTDTEGSITFVNAAAESLTGWTYEEAVGKLLHDVFVITGEDDQIETFVEKVLQEKDVVRAADVLLQPRDRTPFPTEGTATPIKDDRGMLTGVVVVFRDVTEQKRAEEELKKAEKKFRDLFDNASDAIAIHDVDGHFLEVNKTLCERLGYTREELLQMTVMDIDSPECAVLVLERIEELKREGHLFFEIAHITKDGEEIPVELSSRIIEYEGSPTILSIARDITERKKAEEELRRIAWLISKSTRYESLKRRIKGGYEQPYGDLAELNSDRLILDSVGENILADIVSSFLDLLDTSAAVYEKNGDYALGTLASGWCRFLDQASRNLCHTDDNKEALQCGRWHCHESCWTEASQIAIEIGQSVDIRCRGGIRIYAVPVWAGGEIVGSINFGYGDPPADPEILKEIAERYNVNPDELLELAESYESRPLFMIDLAKNSLITSAQLISTLVERKLVEEEKARVLHDLEGRVKELGCLYSIDELERREGVTVDEVLEETVHLIPPSWQYPDITGCCIAFEDREYTTENFKKTPWMQRADITVGGKPVGFVEVCYLERKPEEDEGPFSIEERNLITSVAARLGEFAERKQTEKALQQSERRYRTLLESVPVGVGITSLDGQILGWNDTALQITGYSKEEIEKINVRDFYQNPEERESLLKKLQEDGFVHDYEVELNRKDGTPFCASLDVALDTVDGQELLLTMFRDITEPKRAAEALQESEEKYRDLVETLTDVIYAIDENGVVIYVSPAVEPFMGYSPSEVIGHHFKEFVHEEDLEELRENFLGVLSGRPATNEYRALSKSGETRWLRTSSRPVFEGDRVVGVRGVLADITERKRAELQMKSLFRASKLINSTMETEKVFEFIRDSIQGLVGFDNFIIFLASADRKTVYPAYTSGEIKELMEGVVFHYGEGSVGQCMKQKKSILTESSAEDETKTRTVTDRGSQVIVPLIVEGECTGALHISRAAPGGYTLQDVAALEPLSEVISSAVKNAKLHNEIKAFNTELERRVDEKSKRTEILLTAKQNLQKERSWENGIRTIVESACKFGFERCGIYLVNQLKKTLDFHFGVGIGLPDTDTSISLRNSEYFGVKCVQEKRTIFVKDAAGAEGKQITEAQSFVWVPIVVENEVFAAITGANTSEKVIADDDIKDLEILAGMCAAFIDRTRIQIESAAEKNLKTKIEHWLDSAECYIVAEKKPKKSFDIFVDLVTHGIPGFAVSREHPEKLRRRHNLVKTPLLWLSRSETKNAVNPDDLSKLSYIIEDFVRKNEESVIVLDGVEYLITQTGFVPILKFLQQLRDIIVRNNSRLVIPLHKDTLSLQDYSILEREFTIL